MSQTDKAQYIVQEHYKNTIKCGKLLKMNNADKIDSFEYILTYKTTCDIVKKMSAWKGGTVTW